MKTNQTLTRKMGGFEIAQRTHDGMFCATTLLNQWNKQNGQQKQMVHYFDNDSSKEFINTILEKESFNQRNSVYLKSRGKYNGGTWMHPLLFIDFAMWINPSFKYDVLKFVYDELLKFRNDAGDSYIQMSSAIAKISPDKEKAQNIQKVAQAINIICFGKHENMIRNRGDENDLRDLSKIENEIVMLINEGFVKDFNSLMNYLRKKWTHKYQPSILTT